MRGQPIIWQLLGHVVLCNISPVFYFLLDGNLNVDDSKGEAQKASLTRFKSVNVRMKVDIDMSSLQNTQGFKLFNTNWVA